VEDVLADGQHFHLRAHFVRLDADAALGVLQQLLSDLLVLRLQYFVEKEKCFFACLRGLLLLLSFVFMLCRLLLVLIHTLYVGF